MSYTRDALGTQVVDIVIRISVSFPNCHSSGEHVIWNQLVPTRHNRGTAPHQQCPSQERTRDRGLSVPFDPGGIRDTTTIHRQEARLLLTITSRGETLYR